MLYWIISVINITATQFRKVNYLLNIYDYYLNINRFSSVCLSIMLFWDKINGKNSTSHRFFVQNIGVQHINFILLCRNKEHEFIYNKLQIYMNNIVIITYRGPDFFNTYLIFIIIASNLINEYDVTSFASMIQTFQILSSVSQN